MSDTTCYTIISRDAAMLRWCVQNARERAGMPHEWLVVHWLNQDQTEEQTRAVIECCEQLQVRRVPFEASHREQHVSKTDWFLYNLYHGWNLGYEESHSSWVARLGSDQFFSWGWLAQLHEGARLQGPEALYHCWTVESPQAKKSRHEIANFGIDCASFDPVRFDVYAQCMAETYRDTTTMTGSESCLLFTHPTRGLQARPDGCTWLQTRRLWEQFGPLPDQINQEQVTGDVAYIDTLSDAGMGSYVVPRSITYHLVRGESREVQA